MKKHFYKKEQNVPLYHGKLVIIFTNDTERLKRCIPEFGDNEVHAQAWISDWKGFQGFFVILNFKNSYSKITNGMITHESIHIAHFIAKERGFKADFENDEPITYLAEFITNEIYKFMDKHNFKAKL